LELNDESAVAGFLMGNPVTGCTSMPFVLGVKAINRLNCKFYLKQKQPLLAQIVGYQNLIPVMAQACGLATQVTAFF
jgi:hypothetical protein